MCPWSHFSTRSVRRVTSVTVARAGRNYALRNVTDRTARLRGLRAGGDAQPVGPFSERPGPLRAGHR